jgi:AcrR family transcriptional regulator
VNCVTASNLPAGSDTPDRVTREERRRRTEATILDAARELFAEQGFERATIRAVAARAHVDPALVMQYYGNKEGLFAASARWQVDHTRLAAASLEDVPLTALEELFAAFEDPVMRDSAIALLRNCLTHESALGIMRDDVMCEPQAMIAKTIGGPDAELRAGLLGAAMIGTMIVRYLLEIPAVATASREDIERIMAPVLKTLVDPDT